MTAESREWSYDLKSGFGHADITSDAAEFIAETGIRTGILSVNTVGSTGGITTIEYESGALADLERAVAAMAPENLDYAHNARWGDGNGFSHIRSALIGTSVTIPIIEGKPALGTWQQLIVINFDNCRRDRRVTAVAVGT